ncbi:hypothetical protein [Sphingomonas sp. PR090111-T3T-6A]|nr:hypothetical protein [Sphingomonas sp. PR090111-T3T-6A]
MDGEQAARAALASALQFAALLAMAGCVVLYALVLDWWRRH